MARERVLGIVLFTSILRAVQPTFLKCISDPHLSRVGSLDVSGPEGLTHSVSGTTHRF